jgi:type IV pilus assembly protein PilE
MGKLQRFRTSKGRSLKVRRRGFTLLELMIVVAIIGLLAAVAVPSYQDYVRRGRISEALGVLGSMQAKMDQYYLDNRSYLNACGAANSLAPLPASTAFFNFTCPTLSTTGYTVTAGGANGMASFQYSLTLAGGVVNKTTDLLPSGWDTTNAGTCWVFKKDGSC